MKAIILITEENDKLGKLTISKPKELVKVNGIPIIDYQIEAYLRVGIKESDIIVSGYKINFIKKYLDKNYPDVNTSVDIDLVQQNVRGDIVLISVGNYIYEPKIINDFLKCNFYNSIATDKGQAIGLYKINTSVENCTASIVEILLQDGKHLIEISILDKLQEFATFNICDFIDKKWFRIDSYKSLYEAEKAFSSFSIKSKKALVFDLDGTVYLGNIPITNTINFINQNSDKFDFYYMTNNTSCGLHDYIEKLLRFGIKTSIEHIISPLIPLVAYLKKYNVKNVYVVGNKNFQDYLKMQISDLNYTSDKNICEAVIVAYDTELTYEKLKNATLLLYDKNIKLLATHEDMVCPTEFGGIPDAGSFLKIFEIATLRKPDVIFGKPNKILLDSILKKYNKNEIAIAGDRLYTDKLLANNSKIDFILVLSGESKRENVEELSKFPEAIIKDFADIF